MRKLHIILLSLLLIGLSCAPRAKSDDSRHIYIIATNDMHANIYAMPQLATLVQRYEAEGEVLLFDSGDRVSGNAFVDDVADAGVPMIELMNMLGYDAVTLGNHEFDKGRATFDAMIDASEFVTLCANVHSATEQPLAIEPYAIFEVEGIKIGVVGVVGADQNGHPLGRDDAYASYSFSSDVATAVELCAEVAPQCDFVVLLSHMGDDVDEEFIARAPECDWVAGGHTHAERNESINGIQLTQNPKNIAKVTIADIEVRDDKIVCVTYSQEVVGEYVARMDVVDKVADIKSRSPELNIVEGRAAELFTQSGVANFTVDALATYPYADGFVPEVTFYHYGGVRLSSILPGDITRGDIFNNDPFNSTIYIGEMTIDQMRRFILDKYNSYGPDGRYDKESHYPYFRSDVAYEIILGPEPESMPNAVDVRFSLDEEREYRVAMCNYIVENYIDSVVAAEQLRPAGVTVRDAMLRYVRSSEGAIVPDNRIYQTERKATL